jgi:hypothetical protein
MFSDSSEHWVCQLPHESALKTGIWPTACLMGWSAPKASDSASTGMARFPHWLPWLGKACSCCGLNISTICLTPDWSSHEEHEPSVYNSLSPCWFESTEGCISSIEKGPLNFEDIILGHFTRRGISTTLVIQQKCDRQWLKDDCINRSFLKLTWSRIPKESFKVDFIKRSK